MERLSHVRWTEIQNTSRTILKEADDHKGTSLIEIYQNCNVFNDGAFGVFTDKGTKANTTVFVEHGQPLVFGENENMGVRLDGATPVVVDLESGDFSKDDLWKHDKTDRSKAGILMRCFDTPTGDSDSLPRPFGIFYQEEKTCYEDMLHEQIKLRAKRRGRFAGTPERKQYLGNPVGS